MRASNGIAVEETFFVATDDIAGSVGEPQAVWVHCRDIGAGVQVVGFVFIDVVECGIDALS